VPPLEWASTAPDPPAALRTIPGVLGIGFGLKEVAGSLTPVAAWRVYVRCKRPRRLLAASEFVPASLDGVTTDVVEKLVTAPTGGTGMREARFGIGIANARGVPGTAGLVACTVDGEAPVLLTNHHVLFGAGAARHEAVWLVGSTRGQTTFRRVGRSLYGKLGVVSHDGVEHHVDCGVGSIDGDEAARRAWPRDADVAVAAPGSRVHKAGAATGLTEGIVVDVAYPDALLVDGHAQPAPRQILVRPVRPATGFSADGDSGAALRDDRGAIVGLLWGSNHRGDTVACHIAPVLSVLGVRPGRTEPAPPGGSRPARARLTNRDGR